MTEYRLKKGFLLYHAYDDKKPYWIKSLIKQGNIIEKDGKQYVFEGDEKYTALDENDIVIYDKENNQFSYCAENDYPISHFDYTETNENSLLLLGADVTTLVLFLKFSAIFIWLTMFSIYTASNLENKIFDLMAAISVVLLLVIIYLLEVLKQHIYLLVEGKNNDNA